MNRYCVCLLRTFLLPTSQHLRLPFILFGIVKNIEYPLTCLSTVKPNKNLAAQYSKREYVPESKTNKPPSVAGVFQ